MDRNQLRKLRRRTADMAVLLAEVTDGGKASDEEIGQRLDEILKASGRKQAEEDMKRGYSLK